MWSGKTRNIDDKILDELSIKKKKKAPVADSIIKSTIYDNTPVRLVKPTGNC